MACFKSFHNHIQFLLFTLIRPLLCDQSDPRSPSSDCFYPIYPQLIMSITSLSTLKSVGLPASNTRVRFTL